jgi:hypothetical protein
MIKSRFESDGGVEHGPRLDQSLGPWGMVWDG